MNANTKIYDRTIDRAAMIRLYERRIQGKVDVVLDGHKVRVDKLIRDASLSEKGFRRLQEAVDQELLKTFKEAHNISKRSLLDLVSDQVSYTYQTVESTMGRIWRTRRPQRRVAEEIVLSRPLHSDQTLAAGWAGISLGEKKRIESTIRQGLAEGLSQEEIALNVRRGSLHKITRNQSRALVTTATTSVYAQADHEVYKANEKAIQGWQYVAVLDSRTTPICSHRDGTIYPVDDKRHLPPAHYNCRSTTVPVFKSWDDISKLEGVAQVRKQNLKKLTPKQIQFYDGLTPLKESYHSWLSRQRTEVQLRHLGDYKKVELFHSGQLHIKKFTNDAGNSIGIKELRALTDTEYGIQGDTRKFAVAKEKLDAMQLGASRPDDFINNKDLAKTLEDYYLLQSKDLEGTLSLTNYRGVLIGSKRNAKRRVLTNPPREDQVIFNPINNRYEDSRIYQPNIGVFNNSLRLIDESKDLLPRDKEFITGLINRLDQKMSINERAVVADNLRILFSRYRRKPEVWSNFKAVSQAQVKFDVMNISDSIETQLRKDRDLLGRLKQSNYIDPVLGNTQLQEIHDNFIPNILARNRWEDKTAPKIARELQSIFDSDLPNIVNLRLNDYDKKQFYLKFAHRLALSDTPDFDQMAVGLGRDLYNLANINGNRRQWFQAGKKILESDRAKKFYELETFGVQKRRMKSRMSGQYFGPYYDTFSMNIRITDPRIQEYAKLERAIQVGLRTGIIDGKNQLVVRKRSKTYWIDRGLLGYEDTRIPITSTSSFSEFPDEFIDDNFVNALMWTSKTKYKVDKDFHDFIDKLMYFEDDRGRAKYFHGLNEYRHYITSRGDSYERFKAMEWLKKNDTAFANMPFIDHRGRIYDRGFIGPQSGETFRPFLNTAEVKNLGVTGFRAYEDQIGAFLGGLDDFFEGRYNSLSFSGRQKIAAKWRPELVKIGNHMLRGKPNDIRAILENPIVGRIEGEELGKFFRFAIESAKMDNYLKMNLGEFPVKGELFHISTKPLKDLKLNPRVPNNFLVKEGFEDGTTPRVSFASNVDDALKAMSMNLKGKKLYVYRAPPGTDYKIPTTKQVPDVKITSERWVLSPVELEPLGSIQVKDAIDIPLKYKYGDNTASLYGWNWSKIKSDINPYSKFSLEKLNQYKTALAMEQDASSSGAQIIALTTRNKQLAELSNVIPTSQKKRLYDEIAAATFNDPRFRAINQKLGLSEKDLRKASKAQNMVTFYGAGERTGILNVETKLAKILDKDTNLLVVKASERDKVLSEISARIARVERFDPEAALELRALRNNVRDIFNKGLNPGQDIIEQLYFLDPATKDIVDKLSQAYSKIVTPDDFKQIAKIMSEHLAEQVPILKDFTKYFGRLAEDFLVNADPAKSNFDWKSIWKIATLGKPSKHFTIPDRVSEILGIKAGERISEKILKRFGFYNKDTTLYSIIHGVKAPTGRRTGAKFTKFEINYPTIDLKKKALGKQKDLVEYELFYANKMPKSWTNVPWVNFDKKTIEQHFTQRFEERLVYKNKDGEWVTNILQVPQKTEATWWEQIINKSGKINDIADATKARTAFAVNGNHSNDAVIVKKFHLWGRKHGISTSTIHDAFFTNIADMMTARKALRSIYADSLKVNVIEETLKEMRARGMPKILYDKYRNEAIELGLIPVVGRSRINGKLLKEEDVLKAQDILKDFEENFAKDFGWYGVG